MWKMDTPLIFLIIAYVIVQAAAMGFLYLTLCEVLRRLERIAASRGGSDADA